MWTALQLLGLALLLFAGLLAGLPAFLGAAGIVLFLVSEAAEG